MRGRIQWDYILAIIVLATAVAVVAALILVKLAAGDTKSQPPGLGDIIPSSFL